ncbi:unnamed protein product [Chrysodeixis includens]|uniref:Uncharacterized protein n=1 Tax=Chrysodeixis includens TaxID=689277 RepID=A0A9N8KP04_CHRIL|nr:unnamed protein product [Chrysodeixis includens]
MRDLMRRRIRNRLQNRNQRTPKYKYEDELSFLMPYFREPNNVSQPDPASTSDNADSTASSSFSETTAGAQREPPWMSRLRESLVKAVRNPPLTSAIRESVAEILHSPPLRPLLRESTARPLHTPPLITLFGEPVARAQRSPPLRTRSDTNDVVVVEGPAPPIVDLTLSTENVREDPRPSTSGDSISIFVSTLESTLRTFNPYYLNQAKTRLFQVVQDVEFLQLSENRENGPNTAATGSNPTGSSTLNTTR